MADLEYDAYEVPQASSEIMNRPSKKYAIHGQAAFLGLAILLKVPILSSARNIESMTLPAVAGAGASFTVSRFDSAFQALVDTDFVNAVDNIWFRSQSGAQQASRHLPQNGSSVLGSQLTSVLMREDRVTRRASLRYVTKKISTKINAGFSDAQHLASIVNEMRILSNQTLRQSHHIASLLGISWYERPDQGRYWPQLLIESAEHGTLDTYIASKPLTFQMKLKMGLDILAGLNYLHVHGISHCDIKPANILIFDKPDPVEDGPGASENGLEEVTAKLSDFGCAVIHSDYNKNARFQARIGTSPWAAPELEHPPNGLPVALELLHKADIYSFGLVMSSVLMDGSLPFRGLTGEQILNLKLPEEPESSAWLTIHKQIRSHQSMTSLQEYSVALLLFRTLSPNPEARSDIKTIMTALKVQVLSLMSQWATQQTGASNGASAPTDMASDVNSIAEGIASTSLWSRWGNYLSSTVQSTAQAARGMLSTIGQRSSVSNQLENDLLRQQYLKVEPILPVKSAEPFPRPEKPSVLQYPIAAEDDADHALPAMFDGPVSLGPTPDLCFEYGFVAGALPLVAIREITKDLIAQSTSEHCSGDVLYALAGCYFNGAIVQQDVELGLYYFRRAAEAKHQKAVGVLQNVFESCGRSPPEDLLQHTRRWIDERGSQSVATANLGICKPVIPWTIDDDRILAMQWAPMHPEDNGSGSDADVQRRLLMVERLIVGSSSRVGAQKPQSPAFDFSSLPSYRGSRSYVPLSDLDTTSFFNDVRRFGCLERSNGVQFTLLQESVCFGDREMVNLLIGKLEADLDNYGNTPGWTPLWLACYTGQFPLARLLIAKGASTTSHDSTSGFTILHLLNQFSDGHHIEILVEELQRISSGSININKTCNAGLTPLHATFLGWDFSNGAASRVLLKNGADPTVAAPQFGDFMTPIGLCVSALDYKLLDNMLRCPHLLARQEDSETLRSTSMAQACAYRFLVDNYTEFYFRSVVGNGWEDALDQTLHLLVDDAIQAALAIQNVEGERYDLLGAAILRSRRHVARSLLNSSLLFSQNLGPGKALVNLAIERRLGDVAFALIAKGAKILEMGRVHPTVLHAAAHYNPDLLEDLIELIDGIDLIEREGRTMQQILQVRNKDGFDVVGLLLAEGTEEQLPLVEELRQTFTLDLDEMKIPITDDTITLTSAIVILSTVNGLLPLSQIQYLLNLSPPPRFVCSEKGTTLLSLAVSGPMSYQDSLSYIGHQITQIILDQYSDIKNLAQLGRHTYPLHRAAGWANNVAIDMMKSAVENCKRRHPDANIEFTDLVNMKDRNGVTALDFAVANFVDAVDHDNPELRFDEPRRKTERQPAALRCYKMLRELGALHHYEFNGRMMRMGMIYTQIVDNDADWLQVLFCLGSYLGLKKAFMERNTLVMRPDDNDPEVIQRLQENPRLAGRIVKMRVVELVWLFDDFTLRSYNFHFSAVKARENMMELVRDRLRDRTLLNPFKNMNPDADRTPWKMRTYEQKLSAENGPTVTWTRGGRTWSGFEARRLCNDFDETWAEIFGETEEALSGRDGERPVLITSPE